MRKSILITTVLGLVFAVNVQAQAVRKFNSITDTYYGFPNLATVILRGAYVADVSTAGVDFNSIGPTGIRSEFMLTDKFGVGIDAFYSSTVLNYKRYSDVDSIYYNDKASYTRFQSLFMMNLHYGGGDKLDVYSSLAVGYASRKLKYETNDPNYHGKESVGINFPVGFRISTGMRYMFTRFIGVNAAIGIGGPLLSFGVTAKF